MIKKREYLKNPNYVEIKQYISEQAKGKSKNILRQTKIKIQNMEMWNAAKTVERGNFIEINTYIKKKRKKRLSNI